MDLKETRKNMIRHPWELSRDKNILKECKKLENENGTWADIGAGDRYFSKLLLDMNPNLTIYAVDTGYDKKQRKDGKIILLDNIDKLEDNSIDCMTLMDVLEHIEDDSQFVELLLKKLKKDSNIIITVPAFQSLFSEHDVFLGHYRRYNKKSMLNLLKKFDCIEVEQIYYFYTCLALVRLLQKNSKNANQANKWKYAENDFRTEIVKGVLDFDYAINKLLSHIGCSYAGLSLFVKIKVKK